MLIDDLREFVAITEAGGKASNPRLKKLMVTLRRAGLTSPQIVDLSGGKLSDTIVRQYTGGWGGVKKSLVKQFDALMGPLRELILSNRNIRDVEIFNKVNASVEAKGSSFEEVAELNGMLGKFDIEPGEVGEVLKFYREAKGEGLTPSLMRYWKIIDDELARLGLNRVTREKLLEACVQSGSVYQAIMNLRAYNVLADKRGVAREAKEAAADATKRRVEEEGFYNQFKEGRDALNMLLVMNWSIAFLLAAPNALKGADTKKKQAALFKHLSEYEYTEVEGEVRLVQRKDVYHDQAKFAEAFWEVRSAINKGGPLDSDRLVYLIVLFMAKLPGLTLGDFAALLLKSPDLTDREKTLGEYLKSMDDRAGKMWRQEGPSKIGMDVGLLGLFRDAMRRSLEEQEKRYVSEEERDAYKAMVSMATGTLPPGTDLRSYLGFMINMIKNLTNALAVDDGVLSPHEKDVIEGLSKYIVLLEKVRVEDSKRAQRVKEEDVRIDLPIGLAQNDDGEWVVRETLTPQVDPNLLSSIDQQTRTKVIPQLLKYSELSDEIFGEIAEDVNVKASTVKVLASYLKTDPASRDELKAMGYSNSLLPGWVYVNSGDKFVEPPPARAQR